MGNTTGVVTLTSPVKKFRETHGFTVKELAKKMGYHQQTLLELEAGCFFSPLSDFVTFVGRTTSIETFINEYYQYQDECRRLAKTEYPLEEDLLGDGALTTNPYGAMLENLGIGNKTFQKAYCLPSGPLFRISQGKGKSLPKNLKISLVSYVPDGFLDEWEERHVCHNGYLRSIGKIHE